MLRPATGGDLPIEGSFASTSLEPGPIPGMENRRRAL